MAQKNSNGEEYTDRPQSAELVSEPVVEEPVVGEGGTDPEIEEFDYTAQTMLQAPIETSYRWKDPLRNAFAGKSNRKAGRSGAGRSKRSLFFASLTLAFFCFLLTYGIASLFYLQVPLPEHDLSLLQYLRRLLAYSQGNILLILFFIAFFSIAVTASIILLFQSVRKLQRIFRQGIKPLPAKHPVSEPMNAGLSPHFVQPQTGRDREREHKPQTPQASSFATEENTLGRPDVGTTEPVDPETVPDGSVPDKVQKAGFIRALKSSAEAKTKTRPEAASTPGRPNQEARQHYDTEQQNEQFYSSLKFLLRKKWNYSLQSLMTILSGLLCILLTISYLGQIISPLLWLFGAVFLMVSTLSLTILRNQYIQSMETLFQSTLLQIYQYSGPTNSYNQLHAVNMLYAFAFAEARYFQNRVIAEFQNILKLTRSSWYQTKYNNSPSILVEEALRKWLSAVDFRQLLFANKSTAFTGSPDRPAIFSKQIRHLHEWLYYLLFLKDFQKLGAFRDQATVSLLSRTDANGPGSDYPRNYSDKTNRPGGYLPPHFVLENYYLVGINLSNLRITEAHFRDCQLSHSNWTNSDLSDCSISSCHLDQIILYQSCWRRFLWHANTAREIDIEQCFFLQGNIKYCNLQGIQSRQDSGWKMQHCLLQECDLNHSTFCLDGWQNVKASGCGWNSTLLSLNGELYHRQSEELPPALDKHLQIKA
ncbi:pentapeptide repeat-containing protein [Candidatus Haliotispira prima]|uniref:Pentapeptide repeat-containing protein n=1 Tax=Candidatus Haliotispira prima TaxID=3034016 RepID=A0ABY8MFG1_9SPIO|nr:pentapeptide repeat-containing protein [Candidatus Haliotispira prima]